MNQSGVATILAIGITALLLCLGIAFVTTSIVENKAAANYQSMVTAREAAQTAFNRAVALMKQASTDPQECFNEIVSHDSSLASRGWKPADYESLAAKLTTVVNGITYYSLPNNYPSGYTAADSSAVSWVYFRVNQTDTDKIIGRIAYVVIPNKGKIDPWAVIDSGVNSASPPSEVNYGSGISSIAPDGSPVYGRPGRDITELCLKSLEADAPKFASTYTQNMSVIPAGGLVATGNAGKWKDYEQIFTALGIATNNDTARDYFKKVFYVNAPEDLESYWEDKSGDNIRDPAELIARFDLTGTNWNTLTVNQIVSSTLGWLANWKSPCGLENYQRAKSQIIANLIDYCDSNYIPTTDGDLVNDPSYLGLENVPYINRVMVSITGTIGVSRTGSGSRRRYAYTFTTQNAVDTVQVVDMYGVSRSIQAKVNIGNIQLQWGRLGSLTTVDSSNFEIISSAFNSVAAPTTNGYSNTTPSNLPTINYILPAGLSLGTSNSTPFTDTVIKARIGSLKVRLFGAGTTNLYDYSFILDNNSTWDTVVSNTTGTSSVTGTLTFTYETNDPRQNSLPPDWVRNTSSPPGLTSNNAAFNPNPGGFTDPEPSATYPYLISTAYIRNAPMKSPWELGFIHRAKAFQTLNLKKYNDTERVSVGAGGNNYSDGDANILDQIKMTSGTTTLGKININSDNKSVLRTLFDNIKVGSNKVDPGSGGTALSVSSADNIANTIISVNGSQGSGTAFPTRASILSNPTITNLLITGTTDATKEEIIGKFINLTKAESPEEYTVIAVGEAIRDIGGTRFDMYGTALSTPTDMGTYDLNSDEILASQKILAIIKRNFTTKKFYIERMMYLSD